MTQSWQALIVSARDLFIGRCVMGKFTKGLDWTDVEMTLRAVDGAHAGRTKVTISAGGIGATGGLVVEIVTAFDALPGSDQVREIRQSTAWPCADCAALPAHVWSGLLVQDFKISEYYQQLHLPE